MHLLWETRHKCLFYVHVVYIHVIQQIDTDVLEELPADIREQVEKEMKLRNKNKHNTPIQQSVINHSLTNQRPAVHPGCSHWSDPSASVPSTEPDESHHEDKIVPLPSPSQVDD